jgi:Zn-dependent protease with chaperone function
LSGRIGDMADNQTRVARPQGLHPIRKAMRRFPSWSKPSDRPVTSRPHCGRWYWPRRSRCAALPGGKIYLLNGLLQ